MISTSNIFEETLVEPVSCMLVSWVYFLIKDEFIEFFTVPWAITGKGLAVNQEIGTAKRGEGVEAGAENVTEILTETATEDLIVEIENSECPFNGNINLELSAT